MHPQNNLIRYQKISSWKDALALANNAPRCHAKTRKGSKCQSPSMDNGRCRMHGGKSTGAPKGNSNAVKHGLHTAIMREEMRYFRELARECKEVAAGVG